MHTFCDRTFSTKADLRQFFHDMLYRYHPDDIVTAADTVYLRELFKHHPRYSEWSGGEIVRFEIDTETIECPGDDPLMGMGFVAVFADGRRRLFSYTKCLDKPSKYHVNRMLDLFHHEVYADITAFRE